MTQVEGGDPHWAEDAVLTVLKRHPEGMSLREVVKESGLEEKDVSDAAKALAKEGLLARTGTAMKAISLDLEVASTEQRPPKVTPPEEAEEQPGAKLAGLSAQIEDAGAGPSQGITVRDVVGALALDVGGLRVRAEVDLVQGANGEMVLQTLHRVIRLEMGVGGEAE